MQDFEKLGAFYLGREYDPATDALAVEPLLYDSKDLTTHAVCVGMTGSGKTGLCISLLEEAAIDGIPALVVDPKGDIGNLLLAFPDLQPGDFRPWVDPAEALRKGLSIDDFAAATAATWRRGLADWGEDGERIRRFRDAVDVAIYTPGSDAGLPLSVLKSLSPPAPGAATDPAALKERIAAVVSGLLGLVGIPADPLRSREHILLSSILDAFWEEGRSLDLAGLIGAVQKPPFQKVGVFDLETFYPARERLELAMAINNLLASPGFEAWLAGEVLDVQRLLYTAEGKPRISIVSIAHLTDAERMFVVTLLLNELVSWMRGQAGTSSLRALFYMDEIFGYFPPSAMPPSKLPMLTLLKQARAFGVGCVLATQNPVDLDYKGLSNAGTWFIGRLQTERDKDRVVDGLQSALPGGIDKPELGRLISGLGKRTFLMRNVHDEVPVVFRTRWALSYLRGPLTLAEIGTVMSPRKTAAVAPTAAPPSSPVTAASSVARPLLPAGVPEIFLAADSASGDVAYRPRLATRIRLHYVNARAGLDAWRTFALVAPFGEQGEPDWTEAVEVGELTGGPEPLPGAEFGEPPAAALNEKKRGAWQKALKSRLYESGRLELAYCAELKLASQPGEPEGDFRARIAHAVHERRDLEVEKLRERHAGKLRALDDRIRRAEDKVEREQSQYSQRKLDTVVSIGTSVLGAIFGGGRRRATSGAAGAARSAGRVFSEKGDVERATENLDALRRQRDELVQEVEAEVGALRATLDPASMRLETLEVAPRKADIDVAPLIVAWEPWRRGADGFLVPAWRR